MPLLLRLMCSVGRALSQRNDVGRQKSYVAQSETDGTQVPSVDFVLKKSLGTADLFGEFLFRAWPLLGPVAWAEF